MAPSCSSTTGLLEHLYDDPEHFPITDAQIKKLGDAVVASIDEDAVCALASRHSNDMPCRVQSINRGSYNISICLEFDNDAVPRRLLRIPLWRSVRDGWAKVQSEVATIQYVDALHVLVSACQCLIWQIRTKAHFHLGSHGMGLWKGCASHFRSSHNPAVSAL